MKKPINKKKKKVSNPFLISIKDMWNSINGVVKKIIAIVLVLFALCQGLIALNSYIDQYPTIKDVQAWDKNLEATLVSQLQQFKAQNQQDWLQRRYIDITDQMFRTKMLMKQYPKDKDLVEDYKNLQKQRDDVSKQIEYSNRKLKQIQ